MNDKSHVMQLIETHEVEYVDLRFSDTLGREQHITISVACFDDDLITYGKTFDGSSVTGWQGIHQSDLSLKPDLTTALLDPFFEANTLILRCDVIEPESKQSYLRDPRSITKRAEAYLKSTNIADTCYFGPELEFFLFDDVRWGVEMQGAFYQIDSSEAAWNTKTSYGEGNLGHRSKMQGGYCLMPPSDSGQDIRSEICSCLTELGYHVETHHHEVAAANQNEINTRFNSLLKKADEVQMFKYVVRSIAQLHGKTATFMPKPINEENGSGMHCHQSLMKAGKNIFSGNGYANLSETALHYIGGIIHHARALNAFTNPATNSYKRLVPGFEAPVLLAYSSRNRSAAVRIPHIEHPQAQRVEARFPDALANPYLAFSAMLLAGIDGILNKRDPGAAIDKDLYHLPPDAILDIPTVAPSLQDALIALDQDRAFLTENAVFTEDFIDKYIGLKQKEVTALAKTTHPLEFEMYYSD